LSAARYAPRVPPESAVIGRLGSTTIAIGKVSVKTGSWIGYVVSGFG
jgi:hypothetical protein